MTGHSGPGRTCPGTRTHISDTRRGRPSAGPHPPDPDGSQGEPLRLEGAGRSAAPLPGDGRRPPRGRPRGLPGAALPAHGELARVRPGRKFARRRPPGFSSPSGPGERRAGRSSLLSSRAGPGGLGPPASSLLISLWGGGVSPLLSAVCACVSEGERGSNKRQRESETKKTRRLRRREGGGRSAQGRRGSRERGRRAARAAGGRRAAGGSRAPAPAVARTHPRTRRHAYTHAHTHIRTPARWPGPSRCGAPRREAGEQSEPAPTSAPLRSAAARLAQRPRQRSCRKMVNDRWKTMGGASQLEDRPRDKPQVPAGPGRGDTGVPRGGRGGGGSSRRAGHPGWSLGRTSREARQARIGAGTVLGSRGDT